MPPTGRNFSYVLPLRMTSPQACAADELTAYLQHVVAWCDDVIVVDGSPKAVFEANALRWQSLVRHAIPSPAHASLSGKVQGVLTGADLARHDRVVIADDDVRYRKVGLDRTVSLLDAYALVRPQNYFSPLPWHALWDTARTLLNRATIGADFPGTLAVRRSSLLDADGYDGDVLFENLELIRTIRAHDGAITSPLDLYVSRLPPGTAHFLGQRTRQAYDDFAMPPRMAVWLAILPGLATAVATRRLGAVLAGAGAAIALAEHGRRRAGGAAVFPPAASVLAPLWVLERAVCSWLAVLQRLRFGGARYGDSIIPTAAHSERTLRRRATRGFLSLGRAPSQAHRLGTGSQPVAARGWREADRWPAARSWTTASGRPTRSAMSRCLSSPPKRGPDT
jgi:hypothetical protein